MPKSLVASDDTMRLHRRAWSAGIALALLAMLPGSSAYLDPGTGAALWQFLVASAFGILVALKVFWNNVKAFFARLFGRKGASNGNEDDEA